MNGQQPQKQNQLLQTSRLAGIAAKAGDMNQLKECARALSNAGGSFAAASRANLGQKPVQMPHLTKQAGNQGGTPHRSITQDRPPQGHGR